MIARFRNMDPVLASAIVVGPVSVSPRKPKKGVGWSRVGQLSPRLCEVHVAQGCRKAACDEVRDRPMQVLVSGGIADAWRETLVDHPAGAREPDSLRTVRWRRGHLFDQVERLAVDHSDFVEGMDMVGGREQRAVTDKSYAFDLSASAAEIRLCLGDDNIGVEPLWRHFRLNEFLEWIATDEVDGCNRGILLDHRKGGSLGTDRLHLKTSAHRRGCLLDDQVVEAPGPDRAALTAGVKAGQPGSCDGDFVVHRRDDAYSLDRLQFCLAGFKHPASADADSENNHREAHAWTAHRIPIVS